MNTDKLSSIYLKNVGRIEQLDSIIKKEEIKLESLELLNKSIDNIQTLIQITAKETQDTLRFHIEDLVQSALDFCFPGKYDFIVDFKIKRGKTEASMSLQTDGLNVDPMEGVGGGVVDIVSFALRLVAWSLSKTSSVIILDEPFKWLSSNLRPLAGEMLKNLSDKLKIQIIMVTHDIEMKMIADKIFNIKQKNGVSELVTSE